jgi:hypothetical protein
MWKNTGRFSAEMAAIGIGGLFFWCFVSASSAASNPNFGTTTFFSSKNEKPVLEKPILGAEDGSKDDHSDKDDNKDDEGGGIVVPGDIFNDIGDTIGSAVDDSINALSDAKKSLFDLQSDFGSGSSSDDETFDRADEFMIAGPRGESLEYMASLKDDGSDSRVAEFNFDDKSLKASPKKSKLLFTNKEVDVDMTSQYVILALIFIISTGSAVGYYQLKKGTTKSKRKNND